MGTYFTKKRKINPYLYDDNDNNTLLSSHAPSTTDYYPNLTTISPDVDLNISELCSFRGKDKIRFVNWGYEQIPQNVALNLVGWLMLLFIFSCLRRKAWNHGHLALLKRISKRTSNQSRGEELLGNEDNDDGFEDVQRSMGYNVWVSLFFDPERRFSVAPGSPRYHRSSQAGGHSSLPTTPSSPGGGAALNGMVNGVFASTAQDADGTDATDVKIRMPPPTTNATPSAATLLRGDGQLQAGNFSFSNPRGFLGWVPPIFKLKDKDYREVSGQDSVNYLNFQRYCIMYLAIVTLLSCSVVLPLNIHGNLKTSAEDFGKTTISNLAPDSAFTWIHAWLGICFLGMAVIFMKNYMLLLEESDEEAEHSKKTVMIYNVRPESCLRTNLLQHFSETFPDEEILDVQVAHDIGRLIQLDYERERAIDALLVYKSAFDGSAERPLVRPYCCGDRFGCCCPCLCTQVDALRYYEDEIRRLEKAYDEERQVAFDRKNLGMAFITFKRKRSMVKVLYEYAKMKTMFWKNNPKADSSVADALGVAEWKVQVAPSPNNICWENLATSPVVWWVRCFLLNVTAVTVMTFASTPATIVTLMDSWKFNEILNGLPSIGPLLSQFLPTWLLWLFAVLLPVLIYYVGWFEGHWTKSVFNHSVMLRSYIFLLTMLLFLPSISLTSFEAAAQFFFEDNTEEKLRHRWNCIFLPHNGAFFVNYVTTAAFVGTGMELVRLPELFMYSMRLLSARSAAERATVKKNQPYSYDYGNHYAWFLCIFSITMAYSISCPLVTPLGLVYAVFKHAVDRHNIYFAYDPAIVKKELHVTATNFMLMAVIFTQCNLLFFQLWRSKWINPLTIFSAVSLGLSLVIFMGWISWGWFDNNTHNKYKRWTQRFQRQSVNDNSTIMEDPDLASGGDVDEDDDDEDDDDFGPEGGFVFVPRNASTAATTELAALNDSLETVSEASSPFSTDAAVRRRTLDRLDSVVSIGSRTSLVARELDSLPSSNPGGRTLSTSSTFPDRSSFPRQTSVSTVSQRVQDKKKSSRVPKLSVASSLDFDERDEDDLLEEAGRKRWTGTGFPHTAPSPTPTQPTSATSSLPTTPSFAGVTNYGAIDASDFAIAHRSSVAVSLELRPPELRPPDGDESIDGPRSHPTTPAVSPRVAAAPNRNSAPSPTASSSLRNAVPSPAASPSRTSTTSTAATPTHNSAPSPTPDRTSAASPIPTPSRSTAPSPVPAPKAPSPPTEAPEDKE